MHLAALSNYVATAAFGMGTWLSINAIFVELPLFVNVAPEQWNLSTYIVLIVQTSCFFPLIYGFIDWKFRFKKGWSEYNRVMLIPIMLLLSAGGLVMAAFVYDKPSEFGGSNHSYLLFVSFFIMSLPCTVSDVMFMPYISRLHDQNTVTVFFVGMGFSALVPSAVSLVQGSNVHLNGTAANSWGPSEDGGLLFGPRSFLIAMASICGISMLGFLMIARQKDQSKSRFIDVEVANDEEKSTVKVISKEMQFEALRKRTGSEVSAKDSFNLYTLYPFKWKLLLAISLFLGAAQNSVVPVILPFAMQPYGQNMYHLTSSLYIMINPIFCFFQLFIKFRKSFVFVIWTICNFTLVTFAFICALLTVKSSSFGPLLCIVFSLCSGLISWERTAVAHILRETSSDVGLFWCGAATQFGSFLGAVLMFLLGNVAHIFSQH